MIVCAGRNETFDFAQEIGVGLIESAIKLTKICLSEKPKSLLFIGSAGSYGKYEIFDIIESRQASNIELSYLISSSYTPLDKILEVCSKIELAIVLLGGKEDIEVGVAVEKAFPKKVFNAVGKFNLNQSASLVKQAKQIITHDTGLMHIASALQKDIISIWGNTTTKFGMYPYVSTNKFSVIEVNDLKCRPCSKIGYAKCPKSHFKCMNDISVDDIIVALK